ncbi:MAG: hypothetical protein AB1733_11810 [Thermodesulfobacteriota bacterium]
MTACTSQESSQRKMRWLRKRLALGVAIAALAIPFSCAQRVVVSGGPRITLPDPPDRVAWKEEGVPEKPRIHYLDPPVRLDPRGTFTAPEDGGILINPKAWRGIRYGLTEWPKWGETVRAIVESHNDAIGRDAARSKPWWKVWTPGRRH